MTTVLLLTLFAVALASAIYITQLKSTLKTAEAQIAAQQTTLTETQDTLLKSQEETRKIVSQKKSGEVRLGQIAENLAPFLEGFPYNPKDCHFLGMPTDFIIFSLDNNEIVFCEIKSGGAKESNKQKQIKNIIKSGRVFYEKIQINETGMHVTREENHPTSLRLADKSNTKVKKHAN